MTGTDAPLCSRCMTPLNIEERRQYVKQWCPSCNTVYLDYVSERYVEQLPDFILRHERERDALRQQVESALVEVRELAGKLTNS